MFGLGFVGGSLLYAVGMAAWFALAFTYDGKIPRWFVEVFFVFCALGLIALGVQVDGAP